MVCPGGFQSGISLRICTAAMNDSEALTKEPLKKVEELLFATLRGSAEEQSVNSLCQQVVKSGGKRVRPRLALLSGMALSGGTCTGQILHFAAAVELLHTATLIHDDVIDRASVRRGAPTLNETDGNHVAVLAGDYMFTRCFVEFHALDSSDLYGAVNEAVSSLVAGEINQLKLQGDLSVSREQYRETIFCKTGALFALTCSGPAILARRPQSEIRALHEYGRCLGEGFQIADDMLDYSADENTLGKNAGEDLSDGRVTLPLIVALERTKVEDRAALEQAAHEGDLKNVLSWITKTGALDECQRCADAAAQQAKAALSFLPDSPCKQALLDLAVKASRRRR